jgi:hypothetical protein
MIIKMPSWNLWLLVLLVIFGFLMGLDDLHRMITCNQPHIIRIEPRPGAPVKLEWHPMSDWPKGLKSGECVTLNSAGEYASIPCEAPRPGPPVGNPAPVPPVSAP